MLDHERQNILFIKQNCVCVFIDPIKSFVYSDLLEIQVKKDEES